MHSIYKSYFQTLTNKSKLRIAPTPSGYLHVGNGVNFVLCWLGANLHENSKLFLRIDDIDEDRVREEYIDDIFESLKWLGINWNDGPLNAKDHTKNWSQLTRLKDYQRILKMLKDAGALYVCNKSRQELEPYGNQYPIEFREQNLSWTTADCNWRMKTPLDFPLPDFVVRRRNGNASYQLANVVDDIIFGTTHIIRGEDLADSTQAQLLIAEKINSGMFNNIKFLHHPLLKDEAGNKLSKSEGAISLKSMREKGESPTKVYQACASMLGLEGNFTNLNALLDALKKEIAI